MELTSNHCRDSSLSSCGSLYSLDIDLSIDESIGPDSDVRATDTRQRRRRLGAEMAIIASTSPEIKALNLPNTPIFPQGMETFHHRSNSNGTFSSCSSISSAGSRRKGALSPLLAAMDDVECSPVSRDRSDRHAVHVFMDEADELVRSFRASNLKDSQKKKHLKKDEKKHVWFDDKENIHPNLTQKQNQGKKPFGFHSSNHQYKQATMQPRPSSHRRSLHRRASLDNLPSPGEICGAPKAIRRAASTSIPFLPSDMNQPNYYQLRRSDHQRRSTNLPKRLSLVTGFR